MKIGQRWPEDEMHKWGSYFGLVPKPIRDLASEIKNSGVGIIDINPGPLHKGCDKMMAFLINSAQEATDLQLCLDTPNPKAIETGLTVCTKKPIINGFSLEPHKMEKILPLAVESEAGRDSRIPATPGR